MFEDEKLYLLAEVIDTLKMSRRAADSLLAREGVPRYALTRRSIRYLGRDLNRLLNRLLERSSQR